MNKISVVVPTYKEAENIAPLVTRLAQSFTGSKYSYEVIIVDDNSSDGIESVIEKLSKTLPVRLHIRKNEKGLSSAVLHGFSMASGNIFLCMDADLSHPPEKVIEMCDKIIVDGADFVIGSRNIQGGSADKFNLYRKLNAGIARVLALPLGKISDPMAGFFCFNAKLYTNELKQKLNPIGWKICLEILTKMAPLHVTEVPIIFGERLHGESKLSLKEQFNYLLHLKRLYYYKFKTILVFGAVGAFGMVIDLSTIYVFKELLHIDFRISRLFGILFAITCIFLLNRFVTFEERPKRKFIQAYTGFIAFFSIGGVINWFISYFLNKDLGLHYMAASVFGILSGMFFNYIASTKFVFSKTNTEPEKQKSSFINGQDVKPVPE